MLSDRSVPLEVTVELETTGRYEQGLNSLEEFCVEKCGEGVSRLVDRHPREFNETFSGWVKECFEQELPRYHAESGLLAVGKRFYWVRGMLRPCWDLVEEWM